MRGCGSCDLVKQIRQALLACHVGRQMSGQCIHEVTRSQRGLRLLRKIDPQFSGRLLALDQQFIAAVNDADHVAQIVAEQVVAMASTRKSLQLDRPSITLFSQAAFDLSACMRACRA